MKYYTLRSLGAKIQPHRPSKIVVVTSRRVRKNVRWAIRHLTTRTYQQSYVYVPDGERAKSWKSLENLLRAFSRASLDKKSLILAVGGGTIGDVAGFAASIYLRGVPYIQIPTTLLAQVDSAIGGKTGINFLHNKNQIGAIVQPIAICIEPLFLKTLPQKERVNGLTEIIKMGLIYRPALLRTINRHGMDIFSKQVILKKLIFDAIRAKEYFVRRDAFDQDIRNMLNFGHTVGHAIELRYGMSHGEAVLAGMLRELRIGELLGVTRPSVRLKLVSLMRKLRIGINKPSAARITKKDIVHDKKIQGDTILVPIVKTLGKTKLMRMSISRYCALAARAM